MKKYLMGLIGLAAFVAGSLIGQTLAFGGDSCCAEASCSAGCNCGCNACGNEACDICPRCGCKMCPVCQIGCTTKKETTHGYCCVCKPMCVPAVTSIFGCNNCDGNGACANGSCATGGAAGCGGCDPGCQDGCDCRCRVHEVSKLVIHPQTKETQVRTCTVQWVCPKCGACGGECGGTAAPSVAPAATGPTAAPPAPAPAANRLPPPPKTTDYAPLPENIRMAGASF